MDLEPQTEAYFEPTNYGFRPKIGTFDAAERIFYNIKGGKWKWAFEGDFCACFDTLSHDFILKQIKGFPFYNVVERFLKAGYVDNNVLIPQKKVLHKGDSCRRCLPILHCMEWMII